MALTAITVDFIVNSGLQVLGTGTVTSSTSQIGSLQVNSGAAIANNLIVGSTADIYGDTVLHSNLSVTGTSTLNALNVNGVLTANAALTATTSLYVGGVTTLNGDVTANSGTRVSGVFTASNASYLNSLNVSGLSLFNNTSTFNGNVIVSGTNNLTVGTGVVNLGGPLTAFGNVTLSSSTSASSVGTGSGALVVAGGAYVGDNLIVNSLAADTSTKAANALYVNGGAWIDDSLVVQGKVSFKDEVYFSGTATYVYSTNTYYTDNIVNMHVAPGGAGSAWSNDDLKDIGFIFNYYKGADKNSFLGFANDSTYLEWYENGAEVNGNFVGTTYGTFKTGDIKLVGITDASNTTSGALNVAGGIGLGGSVYAGGNVSGASLTGRNLTNDGGIVFTDGSGNLINSSALTYNTSTGLISGTISTATDATNLLGGATGSIPFQTATNTTVFLPIGSAGYVLTSNGTTPEWSAASGTTVGNATTATNLAGGTTYAIPYQSAPGITAFDGSHLSWNDSTAVLSAVNVAVTGTNASTTTDSGALTVAGGVGIGGVLNVTSIVVNSTATTTSSAITNALYVKGGIGTDANLYVEGTTEMWNNLTVHGNINFLGTATVITGQSGKFFGDINGHEALYAGISTYTTVSNALAQFTGDINDYEQINFQNVNNGATSSADWVATSADGTDTLNYIDMGITSGNWDGTQSNSLGNALSAHDGYLYAQGGNLVIGASIANKKVKIISGGNSATNIVAVFDAPGTQTTGTNSGALTVIGGVGISKDVWIGGDLNIDGSIYMKGVGLDTITSTTGTFDFLVVEGTGTGLTVIDGASIGGNLTVTNALSVTSTATFTGKVAVNDATNSTATTNGALTVAGGVGVAQDVVVGGAITVGVTTSSGTVPALYSNNVLLASYTKTGITGNSTINLDTFSSTEYRTAKYTMQVVDGSSVHIAEMTVFHDGTDVYLNEYGISTNAGQLGYFDAQKAGSVIGLKFTPTNATAMTIKVVRMSITA